MMKRSITDMSSSLKMFVADNLMKGIQQRLRIQTKFLNTYYGKIDIKSLKKKKMNFGSYLANVSTPSLKDRQTFHAVFFPFPLNIDTVSHPVIECHKVNPLHRRSPIFCTQS